MRAPYEERAADLGGRDPAALAAAARASVEGVTFGADGDERFYFDPVPRVISAAEWEPLAAGLAQRVRALDRWCADVYGERAIVRDGVVPARVVETIDRLEPELRGLELPLWVGIAGLDVVRAPDGRFLVLEDNLRTPSGPAYAVAAREVSVRLLEPAEPPRPLDELPALLRRGAGGRLAACPRRASRCSPTGRTTRPTGSTRGWRGRSTCRSWSWRSSTRRRRRRLPPHQRRPARDPPAASSGQLARGADRRWSTRSASGSATTSSRTRTWRTWCATTSARSRSCRRCAPTTSAAPEVLEEALDRFAELVIKPRAGYGGEGVVICPHAERADVERTRRRSRPRPEDFIAQELIPLSLHPTVIDGRLEPRHVDLRPFVFLGAGGTASVLPGGLTRVAFDDGALVVNSSQNGGAKDTWIV